MGDADATRRLSKKQQEDTWSWVEIGVPFPDGPVKARGAMNEYVALWYKHGKPVCGRAWNNGGVVECSFPYKNAELCGKKDLGGQIQILAYDNVREEYDVWKDWGYVYRWVLWPERRKPWMQVVRCGNAAPIQVQDGNEWYCGSIDMVTETVTWSHSGKAFETSDGRKIAQMYTIVRDMTDPTWRPSTAEPEPPKVYDDNWVDLREQDDWARLRHPIQALNRPLKAGSDTRDYYVALWYKRGKPIMGRIWNNNGKIAASFGIDGAEHAKDVGSLQVLYYNPKTAGFDISWQPYSVAAKVGGEWKPVKVKDSAPCVIITKDGSERLGNVHVSEERASVAHDGKEEVFDGPQVQKFLVLCRKDKK